MLKGIKTALSAKSSFLVLCLSWQAAFADVPRVIIEGVSGSGTLGQADIFIPLSSNCNSLFYVDGQGKFRINDDDWFSGLGLGYRKVRNQSIYGGYLFVDYNESKCRHDYVVLNPGIEKLTSCSDYHLNAYVPFHRRHDEDRFFPSGLNAGGINGDTRFISFADHSQFEHQFVNFEEVGYGLDLGAGRKLANHIACFDQCVWLKGGAYYYHLRDTQDIVGASTRLEIPLNPATAVILEGSYGSKIHGAVMAGLRYQFGHRTPGCGNLCDRFYDPVYRNIATINRGTSIPVVHGTQDEDPVLRRNNIFFFSETGTASLGQLNAGTFENPFASNQLTQATVTSIGPYSNLYFTTGAYVINPGIPGAPNSQITLNEGQSLFGRGIDFRRSAVDAERPALEGGIALTNTNNNTIDSVQLINAATIASGASQTLTGLSLSNAHNVYLSNDVIVVEAAIAGDNAGDENVALGIVANGSSVQIERSLIDATAFVSGNNIGGINAASGIGNYNADFNNNKFTIIQSQAQGLAQVVADNMATAFDTAAFNLATGIGNNAVSNGDTVTSNFTANSFLVNCSEIIGIGRIGGDNSAPGVEVAAFNLTAGIGNNAAINNLAGIPTVTSNFTANSFLVSCSKIMGVGKIGGDNSAPASDAAAFNFSTGIGNNATINDFVDTAIVTSSFTANSFLMSCSEITSIARIGGANSASDVLAAAFNFSTGIGNNALNNESFVTTADFTTNSFLMSRSEITSVGRIGGDNSASGNTAAVFNFSTGIGNNAVNSANEIITTADFTTNSFLMSCSEITGVARIGGDNSASDDGAAAFNFSTGIGNNTLNNDGDITIGDFTANSFLMSCSEITGVARTGGDNSASGDGAAAFNFSTGIGNNTLNNDGDITIGDFTANSFLMSCSEITGVARIGGDNSASDVLAAAFNFSTGIGNNALNNGGFVTTGDFTANSFLMSCSEITSIARIGGANSAATAMSAAASNLAIGIGNNVVSINGGTITATFDGNAFNLNDVTINTNATVNGSNNAVNMASGVNVNDGGLLPSHFNIDNSLINVLAEAGNNTGTNQAISLNATTTSTIETFDSIVNVAAITNAETNQAIVEEGNVRNHRTLFNVIQQP